MSGGSWDYLFGKDLVSPYVVEQLERMASRLDEMGFPEAGDAFRSLLEDIHALEARWIPYSAVARAVEWVDSSDWSVQELAEVVAEIILCKCEPGDDCVCAYDCNCRTRFLHTYDEGLGWKNEGGRAGVERASDE